jgi:hypothetical protein
VLLTGADFIAAAPDYYLISSASMPSMGGLAWHTPGRPALTSIEHGAWRTQLHLHAVAAREFDLHVAHGLLRQCADQRGIVAP